MRAMRTFWKPAPGLLLAVVLALAVPAAGKDVLFVSTPNVVVDAMLLMGEVNASDNVVDLGSGDGRIPITAAKLHGANAVGIEYDPDLVARSRESAIRKGVADQVTFLQQDIFEADIRNATVLTMYLLPEVNLKMRPRILSELSPGTRIVSHDFDMGGWMPDRDCWIHGSDNPRAMPSRVYLWIVPAQVEGRWEGTLSGPKGDLPVTIDIVQRYQNAVAIGEISGAIFQGSSFTGSGQLSGERFSLVLDRPAAEMEVWKSPLGKTWKSPLEFDLLVRGDSMEGEAQIGQKRFVLKAERSREQLRAPIEGS